MLDRLPEPIHRLLRPLKIAKLLRRSAFLSDAGWYRSVRTAVPVDARGEPVPWYTYGAIEFLAGRTDGELDVFEYGSGNSTIWWARRVRSVVSCEHDPSWHARMEAVLPGNVDYRYRPLGPGGGYADEVLATDRRFDVVVIDGRERVECARAAMGALTESGVIVWDNSDRERDRPGITALTEAGFRRVDFWGMGPLNGYGWCTSVFYRDGNCLGL